MQRIAHQRPLSHPTRHTTTRLRGPWCALFALLILCQTTTTTAQEPAPRSGFAAGIVSTNWDRQASAGFVYQLNNNWASMGMIDVGGGLLTFQAQPIVLFEIDSHWSLGFFLGPELAIYQARPSLEEKLAYLNAATGIAALIDLPPRISFLVSAEAIESDAPIARYRLALRAVLWLN